MAEVFCQGVVSFVFLTTNPKFLHILQYYRDYRKDIADPKSELFRLKVEYDAQQINK